MRRNVKEKKDEGRLKFNYRKVLTTTKKMKKMKKIIFVLMNIKKTYVNTHL